MGSHDAHESHKSAHDIFHAEYIGKFGITQHLGRSESATVRHANVRVRHNNITYYVGPIDFSSSMFF